MKPILIDAKEGQTTDAINNLKQQASKVNEVISEYNSLPLESLETKKNIEKAISNPKEFLDDAILNAFGYGGKKVKPNADRVAEMYGLDYLSLFNSLRMINRVIVNQCSYSTEKGLYVTSEQEQEIAKANEVWLKEPNEIEEFERVQELCDVVNKHWREFGIKHSPVSVARDLGVICKLKKRGYELRPNLIRIKEAIRVRSMIA